MDRPHESQAESTDDADRVDSRSTTPAHRPEDPDIPEFTLTLGGSEGGTITGSIDETYPPVTFDGLDDLVTSLFAHVAESDEPGPGPRLAQFEPIEVNGQRWTKVRSYTDLAGAEFTGNFHLVHHGETPVVTIPAVVFAYFECWRVHLGADAIKWVIVDDDTGVIDVYAA